MKNENSDDSSSSSSSSEEGNKKDTNTETDNNVTLKEIFDLLRENTVKYAENLKLLIDMCKYNSQAVLISKDFKDDLPGLIVTLKGNHQCLRNRKMKIKFTKVAKQLEKGLTVYRVSNFSR